MYNNPLTVQLAEKHHLRKPSDKIRHSAFEMVGDSPLENLGEKWMSSSRWYVAFFALYLTAAFEVLNTDGCFDGKRDPLKEPLSDVRLGACLRS